jgi:hypothetical protein
MVRLRLPTTAVACRRPGVATACTAGYAAATMGLAEAGRRRAGGARVFPATATLFAPVWVLERGTCSWLALAARIGRGGVMYAGRRIRLAAHSVRELERRAGAGRATALTPGSRTRPGHGSRRAYGTRRKMASSRTGRNGTTPPSAAPPRPAARPGSAA